MFIQMLNNEQKKYLSQFASEEVNLTGSRKYTMSWALQLDEEFRGELGKYCQPHNYSAQNETEFRKLLGPHFY